MREAARRFSLTQHLPANPVAAFIGAPTPQKSLAACCFSVDNITILL
jgi:hypothetical protein